MSYDPTPPPSPRQDEPPEPEVEDAKEDAPKETEEDEDFWREDEDLYDQEEKARQERRRRLLDEFPKAALHKRVFEVPEGEDDDVSKRLKQEFFSTVMLAVSEQDLKKSSPPGQRRRANEWLQRNELRSLRELLGLPITAARWHMAPRKRMQRPPNAASRRRISFLLGESPGMALLVQEASHEVLSHPRRRAPFPWRGLTPFVEDAVKQSCEKGAFIQVGEKTMKVPWPEDKMHAWEEIFQSI